MSIQSKYFMDDRIKARHIVVATNAGVVTLNGEIADETERAEALLLARTTEGVKRVEDNLTIASASAAPASAPTSAAPASAPPTAPTQATPAAPPAAGKSTAAAPDTDTGLADRIKSQLTSDTQMKNAPIEVTAKSGVVTLQGTAPTRAVKEHALTAVSGIDGVSQVVDRIEVSAATHSPAKSSPARKAKR
jgi:osmotically-inducible protein OsmY